MGLELWRIPTAIDSRRSETLPSQASSSADPDHASEIAVVGIDDDRWTETAATTDRHHRHRRRLLGQEPTKKRSTARDEQPLQCIAEVTQEELAPEVEEKIAEATEDNMKNLQDLQVKVEATRPESEVKAEQQRVKERTEPSASNGLFAAPACLGAN